MEQLFDLGASVMKLDSLAAVSAAISSSLGSVNCLSGTSLALAIITIHTYKYNSSICYETGISEDVKLVGLLSCIS